MKKSKYNIFRKISTDKEVIFNSNSLAIAETDDVFYHIYNNLDNLDLNIISPIEKATFEEMFKLNFIVDDEIDEVTKLEYLRLKRLSEINIFNLAIFPTLCCNFDCYYCYEKNKTGVMSGEIQSKILELIRYYAERKVDIKITWHGGEPTLAFDIILNMSQKMIEICDKNNVTYRARMKSNGYLINDDISAKLKDCKISTVDITLDGPPERHNRTRYLKNSKKGTFDEILENITRMKSNGIRPWIIVNINKSYSIDELMRLFKMLKEKDLEYNFSLFQEIDSDSSVKFCLNDNCMSNKEFADFSFEFNKKLLEADAGELVEKNFFPKKFSNYCEVTSFSHLDVDPEGYLYKCSLMVGLKNNSIGNILDKISFEKKLNNNLIDYMTWSPFKFEKCRNCNILPICSGNCPKKGFDNGDPYCNKWKFTIEKYIDLIAQYKYKE